MFRSMSLSLLAFSIALTLSCGQISAQEDRAEAQRKKMEKTQAENMKRMGQQMFLSQLQFITHNKALMKDLQIVEEQLDEIKPLMQEYQKAQQEIMSSNMELQQKVQKLYADKKYKEAGELGQELQKSWSSLVDDHVSKLEDVLLPHQLKRVQQISRQQSVKMRQQYHGFLGLPLSMAGELGLDNEQKNKLAEATKKADKELREEVEKLTKEKMDKILSTLPKSKRNEYEELVGEIYDTDAATRKMQQSYQQPKKSEEEDETD